jgi:ubiquinone/menaquinone biosynthesis C-methylase UbiE
MNISKAAYFDSQIDSEWANKEYTNEERARIDRMLTLAGWMPEMNILEPGCGTGRLSKILAASSESRGSIVATDISPEMVESCRNRLRNTINVRVECVAVEDLALEPGTFDLVICHQVFPHFDDKKRALKILTSCLKPSGRLVVCHFINSAQINDMHRKTDPSVMADSMPSSEEMHALFEENGLAINLLEDDDRGYLLIAEKV